MAVRTSPGNSTTRAYSTEILNPGNSKEGAQHRTVLFCAMPALWSTISPPPPRPNGRFFRQPTTTPSQGFRPYPSPLSHSSASTNCNLPGAFPHFSFSISYYRYRTCIFEFLHIPLPPTSLARDGREKENHISLSINLSQEAHLF